MTIDLDRPRWWAEAACRGLTELFFADDRRSQTKAVAICATCPVRSECLAAAVEVRNHTFGVRGGLTPAERSGRGTSRHRARRVARLITSS